MPKQQILTWGCSEGLTLGDLRAITEELQEWEDDSEIRVKTRLGANASGSKVRVVTVVKGGN
jgi:hypothetical protein